MSTILNALKKLEKDKNRGGNGETIIGSAHRPVPVSRHGSSPGWHKSPKWRITVLVALVAGGTAVYLFSNLPWTSVLPSNRKATEAKISDRHLAKKQPAGLPYEPIKEVRTQRSVMASNKREQAHSHPSGKSSDAEDKQNSAPKSPPNVTSKTSINPKKDTKNVSAPSKQPARRITGPPATEKAAATALHEESGHGLPNENEENFYRDAKPLADDRLKVQAIAWSPVAQDRMAVMNDHIVHEGETVNGFSIVAIGQDDVVVKEKGQLWRVKFGRP